MQHPISGGGAAQNQKPVVSFPASAYRFRLTNLLIRIIPTFAVSLLSTKHLVEGLDRLSAHSNISLLPKALLFSLSFSAADPERT